jgi:hypothetical protein
LIDRMGVRTGDRVAFVEPFVRTIVRLPSILVLRVSRALELRIGLRAELRAELLVELL